MNIISKIKRSCHKQIFNNVKKSATNIRIIREAMENHNYQACKVIVVVPNVKKAEKLKSDCEKIISKAVDDVRLNGLEIDIKYRINIISAVNDIYISTRDAEQRNRRIGDYIIKLLEHEVEEKRIDREYLKQAQQKIDKEKEYTLAVPTGTSYKCTYYDSESLQRKQISVNNILIVIADENTNILDAVKRKQRTDKKQAIFEVDSDCFHIVVYE